MRYLLYAFGMAAFGQATVQAFLLLRNAPADARPLALVEAVLILHEVEHGLDQPRRRKDFPVVGDANFGFDQAHTLSHPLRFHA